MVSYKALNTEEEKQIILQAESNRVSGGIYSEDGHRLLKVLGHQEHFEVKYGVTTICDGALGYHAYLRDVVLPTSVVNVGKCAFVHCPQLYKVEMQGVKYIGDMSFALCKSLTESSCQRLWKQSTTVPLLAAELSR